MKKHKLKILDPDNFWSHVDRVGTDGTLYLKVKEGELPIRPPEFSYEVIEEE